MLRATADDRFIGSPPLAFTFGLGGLLLFPMSIGASTVLLEKATPDVLLAAIAQWRASVCFTAPTSYRAMAAQVAAHDLSSLRKCVSAGEALPAATRTLWKQATGIADDRRHRLDRAAAHLHLGHRRRRRAVAPPACRCPATARACSTSRGHEVPRGEVGRLAVKGPTGCRYLADERQTHYVQNGWNLTGDAYRIGDDGQFEYQARTDDMIISGGYNIAGPEVEAALLLHPAVAECAVIGANDEQRGQIVKAFVVLKPGHDGDDALAEGAAGLRQADHRAVQVPARDRVPQRAAAHRDRQAAALSPAPELTRRISGR